MILHICFLFFGFAHADLKEPMFVSFPRSSQEATRVRKRMELACSPIVSEVEKFGKKTANLNDRLERLTSGPKKHGSDAEISQIQAELKTTLGQTPDLYQKKVRCLIEASKNKDIVASANVYEKPNSKSKLIGKFEIFLLGEYPELVNFRFVPTGKEAINLSSHEAEEKALFTLSDYKDKWLQLPRNPFPTEVWINSNDLKYPHGIEKLSVGTYDVDTPTVKGTVVIEDFVDGYALAREFTDWDNPCSGQSFSEEGKKRYLKEEQDMKKARRYKIPIRELFDKDGHINMSPGATIC